MLVKIVYLHGGKRKCVKQVDIPENILNRSSGETSEEFLLRVSNYLKLKVVSVG